MFFEETKQLITQIRAPPFGCVMLYSMLDAEVFLRLQPPIHSEESSTVSSATVRNSQKRGIHRTRRCDSLTFRLLCSHGEIAHCLN